MTVSRVQLLKDRLIEGVKYDYNIIKYPLVFIARAATVVLLLFGKHDQVFQMASNVYRTGWAGSYSFGLWAARYYFVTHPEKGRALVDKMIDEIPVLERTKKFFDDPATMLNGIVNVLKSPDGEEKGVLLLNYSYYFPLFLKFYDLNAISQQYNIVLEPSWAGFCELNILAYSVLDSPVFLQTYEDRDKMFINDLSTNLIPINIGPSWFVNHENFVAPENGAERDIDIIMVAGWAKFKRHHHFFKVLAKLKKSGVTPNVTLVGYPTDMTQDEIRELIDFHGVSDLITIYEWIEPSEVSALFRRAKINILWSKFEGNNRAIIEGMFCDTPLILRSGHNYGQHYDFINEQTGHFADEDNLTDIIKLMLKNEYSPRSYVMENRSCINATKIMTKVIKEFELKNNRVWNIDLEVKINELHNMNYLDPDSHLKFEQSYKQLKKFLKINEKNK